MANIPPEIWLHIATYIPEETLRDLLGISSIFFNIAMDIRYREIVINTTTITYQEMNTLRRLRDPLIASRVHRLKLRLENVKKILNSSANTSDSYIGRQLKHAIARVFGGSKSPWPRPIKVTLTGLMNEIIKITKKLVNVRELYVDICCPPLSCGLRPLFLSFWSSFGPKLHTLSLGGDCSTLIENSRLDGLQELRVEFTLTRVHTADARRAVVVDVLLPFINSLAPHLLSLKLYFCASLDLSTFFAQLAVFPCLKTLTIQTPFNKASGDASCFKGLIYDGSTTLQRVDLCLNSGGLTVVPLSEEPLSQWLLGCLSHERFSSQLQFLDVYPTDMVAGMEFLLDCIQRTSQSLAELIVRDQLLQDRGIEAKINVESSCSNLIYLKLKIRKLDVALTDHLALKLPRIDRLRLSIREYAANDPRYLINTFVQDLGTRSYWYQLEAVGRHLEHWFGGG